MTLGGGFRRVLDYISTQRMRRIPGLIAHPTARCYGMPIIVIAKGAQIKLASGVSLVSRSVSTDLGVSHPVVLRALEPGSIISIGADTGLSGGSFCAVKSLTIGERCLIGADVIISDTDFHPVDVVPRRHAKRDDRTSSPVSIGDDVFLGAKSTILKGVFIGNGSVIGASSVVTRSVPANVVAAGNPCRELRSLRIGE